MYQFSLATNAINCGVWKEHGSRQGGGSLNGYPFLDKASKKIKYDDGTKTWIHISNMTVAPGETLTIQYIRRVLSRSDTTRTSRTHFHVPGPQASYQRLLELRR